jgi:hypothetical protein
MKALATLAFGALALVGANFATAAPAAANNVGVYAGSNGFAIEVSNYRHHGYNRHYSRHNRGCWNRWYRRTHPYRCGRGYNHGYYDNYYYNNNYYYGQRHHRNHWRDRHHRRDNWRDRDHRRNRHHDRDRYRDYRY